MPSRPIFQRPRRRPPPPPRHQRGRHFLARSARSLIRVDDTWTGGIIIGDTATPVTFEHDQTPADVRLLVDWDRDGDFDQPEEDITSLVLSADTFTGRDWPSALTGKVVAGRLGAVLNNTDGRFSRFNTESPLSQGANTLNTGAKVRVITTGTEHPDPVLITRDRFQRSDGDLIATETGLPWVTETPDPLEIQSGVAVATSPTTVEHTSLVDLGTNDYYLQLTHALLEGGCYSGIYYRYQDANNYGLIIRNSGGWTRHFSVVGGVSTETDMGTVRHSTNETDNATIGIHVNGTSLTAYLEGVPVGTATAAPFAATRAGITSLWVFTTTPRPGIRSFHAWDGLPHEVEGCLWTGDLVDLVPDINHAQEAIAQLKAEGVLARAAGVDVTPEIAIDGTTTGLGVGHILNRAGIMAPPLPLQPGDITTGPWAFPRGNALDLARRFEDTEFGFLMETQEGYPAFLARSHRDSSYSLVTFSDTPGTQYAPEEIEPRDWRREVINQAQAGVAAATPVDTFDDVTYQDSASTGVGVANDVLVTLPTGLNRGDLLLVFIQSTVGFSSSVQWLEPIWWVAMRTNASGGRQRVYSHICGGDESGTDVLFYDDTTNSGGQWHARMYVIRKGQWYGSHDGIAMAEHVPGDNPPPLVVPWGLQPAVFFATHTGGVSIGGGGAVGSLLPFGYTNASTSTMDSATNSFDLFQTVAWKTDITAVEDPTEFDSGLAAGYIINECTVVAVRGFNGDPIPQTARTTVERSDLASQDAHGGAVLGHTGPDLFRNDAEARTYCDRVLGRYSGDRPIVRMGFTATKSEAYRRQAILRRVGHRMTLEADGNARLGINGDFHIESISNRFGEGMAMWWVDWELSPADDVLRADTGGSDLTSAIGTTETVFQVDVTGDYLWITDAEAPNMFPFRARCGNEVWLVTGISGASSPQTFTVQRAFNGWDEAHSAGAAVTLYNQWILP